MNADPENFDQLKKLLALKRHETPPPGYFNELPNKIWARIEREDAEPTFWQKIFPSIGIKPAAAYAFGLAVCGALIFTIGSVVQTEPEQPLVGIPLTQQTQNFKIVPVAPAADLRSIQEFSSTNPVTNPQPFFPVPQLQVEPASFHP
jgi:hypothetical protein